ncbi:MAG: hypothetical protein Q8920_15675 [Bacillota bacterium]|nr:hypothetical protein [Bacillota bacterium]
MAVLVTLWSKKPGEIKRFLERYYQKNIEMDDDVEQWIYVYNKPLNAVDIMSAVMDNNDKYQISMCIQLDKGDVHPVTVENHNDIIKGIFDLFYEETTEILY